MNSDDDVTVADVCAYNPYTGSWVPGPPIPSASAAMATAEHQGCVYLCGGSRRAPFFVSATLSMMDPRRRAWSSLPAMPTATSTAGAAVVGSRMYVPGGASSSLQCYDMAAGRWDTSCAPMSVARYSHGVAALHGEVWALGGGGRNGVCSTNLRGGVQPMAQQLAAWCGTATQLGEWCLHGGPVLRGVL